jgi:hypothetical protein
MKYQSSSTDVGYFGEIHRIIVCFVFGEKRIKVIIIIRITNNMTDSNLITFQHSRAQKMFEVE